MTAVVLSVSAYVLNWWVHYAYARLMRYWIGTLETLPEFANLSYMQAIWALANMAWTIFSTLVPFILAVTLTIIIVMYAQVGWLITFKPLEPKFEKIDPIKGFKNKINPFKMKQLFNLTKTFLLMGAIGYMVYKVLRDHMNTILNALTLTPMGGLGLMGFLAFEVMKRVALLMICVAFISYLFERWQWWKGMKMSDKEIKDEYKKLEGDPHIKGKQKQKMYQMAMGAAHEAVPNADVIITNPTHYAIALEYKPQRGMKAPLVIAKGKNHMALYIRKIAEENFIPTVEDPETARALYAQVKIGQSIPSELFVAVAKIIASIMRKRQRQTVVPAPMPVLTNYQPVDIEPGPVIQVSPNESVGSGAVPAPEDSAAAGGPGGPSANEEGPPSPGNALI
jgi:flagellar biosynthetic protein FlhB